MTEMTGPSRRSELVQLRRVVIFVGVSYGFSHLGIARALGRDHSTVISHMKRPLNERESAIALRLLQALFGYLESLSAPAPANQITVEVVPSPKMRDLAQPMPDDWRTEIELEIHA
ncbi:MAG: hypothetical protein AAFY06_00105 [Pseudomonadota bacterium]